MNVIEAIQGRRSVRKFTGEPVTDQELQTLLEAAMAGPSAVNARPWQFLVVRDPETLNKMADANGRAAEPLRGAAAAVLILGDLERAFDRAPEYWVIDGAIAGQNMCLAAVELGLGSVWLGTWPQEEKVANQRALFGLPETLVPHSIIAFGRPAEDQLAIPARGGYEADRVRFEKW